MGAFGSPVLDSRRKYGWLLYGPVVVTVQPLHAALVVVGGGQVQPRPGRGSWLSCAIRAARHQPRDLGGDRRRRVAGLILPAFVAVDRAVRHEEVGRRADVAGYRLRDRRPARTARP